MNFCIECGYKLEDHHKFCPVCGTRRSSAVSNADEHKSDEVNAEKKVNVVACENCGEENPLENDICAGCGIKLNGEEKLISEISSEIKKDDSKSQQNPEIKKPSSKHKKDQGTLAKSEKEVKELDVKKIITIGSFLGLLCIIILFTSGVFDNSSTSHQIRNETSNVDLKNLQAIKDLETKVNNNPEDLESLLHLAHLQNDSKLFEKAIENYKKYLNVKPNDADARVDMGICYYNLGNYAVAIAEMESAVKYKPNHQIAHLNLGIVNLASGNLEKSKEWLSKAIELNPDSEVARRAQELLNSH